MTLCFNVGDSQPGDVLEDGSGHSDTRKDDTDSIDPQQFEGIETKYKLLCTLDSPPLHVQKPCLTRS